MLVLDENVFFVSDVAKSTDYGPDLINFEAPAVEAGEPIQGPKLQIFFCHKQMTLDLNADWRKVTCLHTLLPKKCAPDSWRVN